MNGADRLYSSMKKEKKKFKIVLYLHYVQLLEERMHYQHLFGFDDQNNYILVRNLRS